MCRLFTLRAVYSEGHPYPCAAATRPPLHICQPPHPCPLQHQWTLPLLLGSHHSQGPHWSVESNCIILSNYRDILLHTEGGQESADPAQLEPPAWSLPQDHPHPPPLTPFYPPSFEAHFKVPATAQLANSQYKCTPCIYSRISTTSVCRFQNA